MIRPYSAKDYSQCMTAFKTNVPTYFTRGEIDDFERFLNQLEDESREDNPPYFVLELEGKVIGCGGYGEKKGTDDINFIWGLVHNDFHKQGFGKELFYFRMEQIKLHHPTATVVLDTSQHSYSFFEKYGFKTVKITENFYTEGMHRYDMVWKH